MIVEVLTVRSQVAAACAIGARIIKLTFVLPRT